MSWANLGPGLVQAARLVRSWLWADGEDVDCPSQVGLCRQTPADPFTPPGEGEPQDRLMFSTTALARRWAASPRAQVVDKPSEWFHLTMDGEFSCHLPSGCDTVAGGSPARLSWGWLRACRFLPRFPLTFPFLSRDDHFKQQFCFLMH